MISLLLAAALGELVPMPPPPRSAEELTQPNVDFDCVVLNRSQEARSVSFHLAGRRGYPVNESWHFAATEATFSVVRDETGLFTMGEALYDNTAFERFTGNWAGRSIGRLGENSNSFVGVRFFDARDGAVAVVLERQTTPLMSAAPDFAFAGVCKFAESPQVPLSAAPSGKEGGQ